MPPKAKAKIVKDVTQLVLARRTRMCNFLEYKGEFLWYTSMWHVTMDLLLPYCYRHQGCIPPIRVVVLRLRDCVRR